MSEEIKSFDDLKEKVKNDNINSKKRILKEQAEKMKKKLDEAVESIKKADKSNKNIGSSIGINFLAATIENGTILKKLGNLKLKIDTIVTRANSITDADEAKKIDTYKQLLINLNESMGTLQEIVTEHESLVDKKLRQDLADEIHNKVREDKKAKNEAEIRERKEAHFGPIEKLRQKDVLAKEEIQLFDVENRLLDLEYVDYESDYFLEEEYAKMLVYGEEHKTEDTEFAKFYKVVKAIEKILNEGETKKAIKRAKEAQEIEHEEDKDLLKPTTKEKIDTIRERIAEKQKEAEVKVKIKKPSKMKGVDTGRALLKLDELLNSLSTDLSRELQTDIIEEPNHDEVE